MPKILLIDTDVLIDFLRGRSQAVTYLENLIEESI
jgi:predicted nucleic acid-binding protein